MGCFIRKARAYPENAGLNVHLSCGCPAEDQQCACSQFVSAIYCVSVCLIFLLIRQQTQIFHACTYPGCRWYVDLKQDQNAGIPRSLAWYSVRELVSRYLAPFSMCGSDQGRLLGPRACRSVCAPLNYCSGSHVCSIDSVSDSLACVIKPITMRCLDYVPLGIPA